MRLDDDHARVFDEAYRRHADSVFAVCLRFGLGDRQWALDRTHDVFVRLAEQLPRLQDRDNLMPWLYRVAANCCLMALRRHGRWGRLREKLRHVIPRAAPPPSQEVQARRNRAAVVEAIAALPAKQRAVMTLVYLEGLSQTEAAACLGLSKAQVSKHHQKAVSTLRERDWELTDA
jgi:RNA polymerase sigma-70 factor (ECF subfamily)